MNNSSEQQQYQRFQAQRQQLLQLIERQLQIIQALNMSGRTDVLHRLEERVRADNFKVLVLGEFKRGKSTFINAMLGDEILPAYARPCTAIINEVKWGETPTALLHSTSTDDMTATPQPVPVKELEQYVTIQDGMSEGEAIRSNPFEKVELLWPLDLCRNGALLHDERR
ncbi:dynamin family protein [Leptolyngbya ohadii]|uniref:dynamin family protein n=1 Tax=Leptolyngbya ohadii TaxID=1962290 RepID=UPI000B59C299|nr:dynamin family protein [Leptolyngbya ohadii]